MFADKARIIVSSGKGGDGHVSFRREKFVPAGGPDGGDGGNGGDVIFEIDEGLNTLEDFRHTRKFHADNGQDGQNKRMAGKSAQPLVLKVPEGTVIKDALSGRVIADMSGENRRFMLLKGGHGGNGNQHYATSVMQAPKYAQPGQPARTIELQLELKVIADVGLVGYPNVGKSTLLSVVSNAKPKIANYHFTTLSPILGVVDLDGAKGFVMADIPGLIEGAAQGLGLGHEFLAHIERTRLLVHVVDLSGSEGRDPVEDIRTINNELASYNIDLTAKKQLIAANKSDLMSEQERDEAVAAVRKAFPDMQVFVISAVAGNGVRELLYRISDELSKMPKQKITFEQEFDPENELSLSDDETYTVSYDQENREFIVEGPAIEKMLGYTNLDTEKGFAFFQKFLADKGILDELRKKGIEEGNTVRLYGHTFEFYD